MRALGVRQLAATIFNYTVGSGIYALPALAVARLGAAAPLAFIVCAVAMACIVLCVAEAGSRVTLTGGPYAYVEIGLGRLVGFMSGVLLLVTGLVSAAAVAELLAQSLALLLGATSAWVAGTVLVAAVLALMVLNIRGVRASARIVELMTVIKILPLVLFVLIGVFYVQRAHFSWQATPSIPVVLGTAGIVIFAFSGIESALTPSGEVQSPARTVPLAAFIALGGATALYLAVQWVALGIEGTALAREPTTPLAQATATFAGSAGRTVMIVAASVSMLGYLMGNLLAVPRSLFALARDGVLPRALCAVHPRFRTPHVAIAVYSALLIALALSGTFERMVVMSNLAALVLYMFCALAVLGLRRQGISTGAAPFRIPGGAAIPIATCLICAWLIYATASRVELLWLAAAGLAGLALYALRLRRDSAPHFP